MPSQREKVDAEIDLHAAASESDHPNVAKFEGTFENSKIICLVLELCSKRVSENLPPMIFTESKTVVTFTEFGSVSSPKGISARGGGQRHYLADRQRIDAHPRVRAHPQGPQIGQYIAVGQRPNQNRRFRISH